MFSENLVQGCSSYAIGQSITAVYSIVVRMQRERKDQRPDKTSERGLSQRGVLPLAVPYLLKFQ